MEEKYKIKRVHTEGNVSCRFNWLWNNENKITAQIYFEEEEKLKEEICLCGECVCRQSFQDMANHFDHCQIIMREVDARVVERLKDLLPKEGLKPKSLEKKDDIIDCPITIVAQYP